MDMQVVTLFSASLFGTLLFGWLSFLVWFRYPRFVQLQLRRFRLLRKLGLPASEWPESRYYEWWYRFLVRLIFLGGLLVAAFPLLAFCWVSVSHFFR